ncbi:hypothetical protein MD535_25200 [Vibrio sp. ZSDZ65]|uniref:Uncharacterized protein n=1 Tax=Vibrio qingdaonensis TaxID=2829491 RepID=A0A9X3HZF5_9VIBR|nr:hypothetical protein [Vibrio qingdaonensis]MCW8349283.1 hypothetical protein [Vibrio qingdaonensis]
MGNYSLNSQYTKKVEKQFEKWAEFLNGVVGILAFTLGLASLGTPTPSVSAIFSTVIVIYVWNRGKHHFPKEIDNLRKAAKSDGEAELLLRGLLSKHFGILSLIKKYPAYLVGYLFLLSIVISPFVYRAILVNSESANWFAKFYGLPI